MQTLIVSLVLILLFILAALVALRRLRTRRAQRYAIAQYSETIVEVAPCCGRITRYVHEVGVIVIDI